MSELWNALVKRLVDWIAPKPPAQIIQIPAPPILRPGICECEHERCAHEFGKGKCRACYPADKEWPDGAECACQIFILDEDSDDDHQPESPSPEELERLFKR